MRKEGVRRYEFAGVERFSRLMGVLVGFTFATALAPLAVLYVFRENLPPGTTALLVALFLIGAALAVWMRGWTDMEDSGVFISEGAVVVRLGRLFEEAIPLASIAEAASAEHVWWMGAGVRLLGKGRVAVVTAPRGVVALRLKAPLRVRVAPLVRLRAREIRLSLADSATFLAELGSRLKE